MHAELILLLIIGIIICELLKLNSPKSSIKIFKIKRFMSKRQRMIETKKFQALFHINLACKMCMYWSLNEGYIRRFGRKKRK